MPGVSWSGCQQNNQLHNMKCDEPLMMTGREEPDIPNTTFNGLARLWNEIQPKLGK